MDQLKAWLHYLNPEYLLLQIPSEYVVLALVAIIFAETGLLFGFFLPGDSLLFTAGMFVASGHIQVSIGLLVLLLMLAAILGDQVGYLTGRWLGQRLYRLPDRWYFKQRYITQTKAFYERYGGFTIIVGRFVPIVRTFAPILAGVAQLPYRRFIPFNIVGGVAWIGSMTLLGYALGQVEWVRRNVGLVAIGIVLLSVLPIVVAVLRERRKPRPQA